MKHIVRRMSFRTKLLFSSLLVAVVALALVAISLLVFERSFSREALLSHAVVQADVVAINSRAALVFDDQPTLSRLLEGLSVDPAVDVAAAYLRDDASQRLQLSRSYVRSNELKAPPVLSGSERQAFFSDQLQVVRPVVLDGDVVGAIYLQLNTLSLQERAYRWTMVLAMVLVVALLLALLLARGIGRSLLRPLQELIRVTQKVSSDQDYSLRAQRLSDDELGLLTDAFNNMLHETELHDAERRRSEALVRDLNESLERKVVERTALLRRSNEGLRDAMASLSQAQKQLVESEKMASLGGLVAGVAHEINTPMGNSLTATTYMMERLQALRDEYGSGAVTRSALERFLEDANESGTIVLRNLERAAELVRSFKQVAVDQSSEQARVFLVRDYLESVLTSLHPQLKKVTHQVLLHCDPELRIRSYPGVLSQIVTNFIVNSLMHAFPEEWQGEGVMEIEVVATAAGLRMIYRDNGVGVPSEHLRKIFDPFFTTRRGQGGSGLGLHIVYNMVVQRLGGNIRLESLPGQGVVFTIEFPCEIVASAA